MKIEFEKKPSKEATEKFCKKIEYFLASHKLSIKIELWEEPLKMESYVGSKHTETTYFWIKSCTISTKRLDMAVEGLEVRLFYQGIEENMSDEKIWTEAYEIQDQLYTCFKKDPGNPRKGDPYWKLWDLHPQK